MIPFIAALLSGIAIDVLGVICFHFTDRNKAFLAALTNTLLTAGILFVFVNVSKHTSIAIPYLLGIFIGGLIGVRLKEWLEGL